MGLPSDIIGLIYTYSYLPSPAQWINPEELLNITHSNILVNPAGVYWIEAMKELFYETTNRQGKVNISSDTFIEYIAANKSIQGIKLFRALVFKHSDQYGKFSNILVSNPYGYTYAIPSDYRSKTTQYVNSGVPAKDRQFDELLLLNDSVSIPQVIERYTDCVEDDKEISELLASNPFTFHIFLKQVKAQNIDPYKFKSAICSNPSDETIDYIEANFDKYCKSRMLLANPSAYKLIIRALPILLEPVMSPKNKQYMQSFYARHLCSNPNPDVIALLRLYPQFISVSLAANPLDIAFDILLENPNLLESKAFVSHIAANTNPRAIKFIKTRINNLTFRTISANPVIFYHRAFNCKFTERVSHLIIEHTH